MRPSGCNGTAIPPPLPSLRKTTLFRWPGRCLAQALVCCRALSAPPLAAAAVLAFFLAGIAAAPATAAEWRDKIVVGHMNNYPPYQFLDKDGQPAGFTIDLARAVADVMGLKVEIRVGPLADVLDWLVTGRVDLIAGVNNTEQRSRIMDFSAPHAIVNQTIFARRGTPMVSSLQELRGKKVLLLRNGSMFDYLSPICDPRDLIPTNTHAEALRLLAAGNADYAVVAMLPGTYIIRENKLTNLVPVAKNVVTQRLSFAVGKGNTELLSRFNEGLTILKKTGQYDAIYNKWLGVLEPRRISGAAIAKSASAVIIVLSVVLGGMVLWSYSLKEKVRQRTESLSRALEELRLNQQQLVQAGKMAALGTLVSGVAHEINNPNGLTLLHMPFIQRSHRDAVRILEEHYRAHGDFPIGGIPYTELREELPRVLDEIYEGARRIKRIVNGLKDFARRDDAGDRECLDVNAVARTAIQLVGPTISSSTGTFIVDFADGLPGISGNAQQIEQVVVNLIINACQALPDSGRSIFLATRFDPAAGTVIVRIRDEGVGIAPEQLPHVTDPFFTTKRTRGGTGLGLSISAGIVKDHGGTLAFDSAPNRGTTVTLSFPCAQEVDSV
ncbi:transporter substrate-binding domain-containing protein [Geobacter sp. FeAm09]|uniref:transporter substrate-binding domain-containing protein n=1 Tax=Geobacter sp. FeAm09 TaxID=2597769 RepID=UPI0011EE7CE3|nr:transporter substrate-binding domain-containing protein [Geobacter sp. FeAm09]QEM69306.1 transporter substrate-binding domain-containing protein [Geobacter sp. FeAm09]